MNVHWNILTPLPLTRRPILMSPDTLATTRATRAFPQRQRPALVRLLTLEALLTHPVSRQHTGYSMACHTPHRTMSAPNLTLQYRLNLLLMGWNQALHSTRAFSLPKCNCRTLRCQARMSVGRRLLEIAQHVYQLSHGRKVIKIMHMPGRGVGMSSRCPRTDGPVPIDWIRARPPAPVPLTTASRHLLPRSIRLRATLRIVTRHSLPCRKPFQVRTLRPCRPFLHKDEPV